MSYCLDIIDSEDDNEHTDQDPEEGLRVWLISNFHEGRKKKRITSSFSCHKTKHMHKI